MVNHIWVILSFRNIIHTHTHTHTHTHIEDADKMLYTAISIILYCTAHRLYWCSSLVHPKFRKKLEDIFLFVIWFNCVSFSRLSHMTSWFNIEQQTNIFLIANSSAVVNCFTFNCKKQTLFTKRLWSQQCKQVKLLKPVKNTSDNNISIMWLCSSVSEWLCKCPPVCEGDTVAGTFNKIWMYNIQHVCMARTVWQVWSWLVVYKNEAWSSLLSTIE